MVYTENNYIYLTVEIAAPQSRQMFEGTVNGLEKV